MGAFLDDHLLGIFIGHFKNNNLTKELTEKGWLSWKGAAGLYIATIGVVGEARRLGIGTKLINEVIKWSNDRNHQ